jgi:hypothetical protein
MHQMHGMGDFAKNPAYTRLGREVSVTMYDNKSLLSVASTPAKVSLASLTLNKTLSNVVLNRWLGGEFLSF